jgi:glutamate formiminotransferase/glutamate formiminotransferase/formiminotetrahydrofolate cyclodeaminase
VSAPSRRPSAAHRLLAVPNVSEGRDRATIDAVAQAFTTGGCARLLDVHADPDHHRSVYTLAGDAGMLSQALLDGVRMAIERVDVGRERMPEEVGQHPHVGAVDVVPIVYLRPEARGAACAEALVVAEEIGESLGVPVFLYGVLAGGRTRAELRRGNVPALAHRVATGELRPDFGPTLIHPTAGGTLVGAREPLVAFNLELSPPATSLDARAIAAAIREGGSEGLPGLRAIGVTLTRGGRAVAQVSTNVEQPLELPLRKIVEAVRRHAEVAAAELVGLAPRAALEGFPEEIPMPGFDADVHVIENALGFH